MENKRKKTCRVVKELPFDCWCMICSFLEDQKDFQAISLSIKGFYYYSLQYYKLSCFNIDFVTKPKLPDEPKVFVTRLSYIFQKKSGKNHSNFIYDKIDYHRLTRTFPNLKFLSLVCRYSSRYRICDLPQLEKLVLEPNRNSALSEFEFNINCTNLQVLRIQEENFSFEEGQDLVHRGLVDFSTNHEKLTTVELCFGYRVNNYQKLPNLNSHEVDILSYLYEIPREEYDDYYYYNYYSSDRQPRMIYDLKKKAVVIPKLKKLDLYMYYFPSDKQKYSHADPPVLDLPKGLESLVFADLNKLKSNDDAEDELLLEDSDRKIIDFVLITQHIRSTIQKIYIEISTFRTSHMKSIDDFPLLRRLKIVSSITIREISDCPNLEKIKYSEISHSQSSSDGDDDFKVGNDSNDTQIFKLDEVPKLIVCSLENISFKTLVLSRNVSSLDFLELVKWDEGDDRGLKIKINGKFVQSPTTLLMYSDNQKFKFNDPKFLYGVKEIVLENSRLEFFPYKKNISVKNRWESFQYFGVEYEVFREYFNLDSSSCSPIKLVIGTPSSSGYEKTIDGGVRNNCLDEIKSLHLLETHSLQQIKRFKNLEEIVVESTITLAYYDIKYRELKITDNLSLERLNIVLGKKRHKRFQKIVLSRSKKMKKKMKKNNKHLKIVFETSCDGYEKKLRVYKSWGLLDEDSLPYSGQRIHRIPDNEIDERVEGLVEFGKGYEDGFVDDVSVFVNISDCSRIFVNETSEVDIDLEETQYNNYDDDDDDEDEDEDEDEDDEELAEEDDSSGESD